MCKKGAIGGLCDKTIPKFRCKFYSNGIDYKCNQCDAGFGGKYCEKISCNNLNMCKNGGNILK